MGQKQTSSRTEVDVGDPLHVQHKAQLKLDSRKGIVLKIPELDAYLRKEGVPFSDRTTWDVLRYVYHAGGLELVKNTLQLIRERRAKEPAPDYDLTSTADSRSNSISSDTPSSDRRRNWSSHDDEVVPQTSSESARESMRKSGGAVARRNSSSRKVVDSPKLRRLKAPSNDTALSEVGEDWRSARSSGVYETQEVTIRWVRDSQAEEQPLELIRPASKVWKRAMAPEVHADLVRAIKARESQVKSLNELQEVEVRRTHTILITDPDMNG